MASCCVANCNNKKANNPDVIFFKLPDELTRQWRLVINRTKWTPKENSKICHEHFSRNDFSATWKRLEPGAEPCLNLTLTNISSGTKKHSNYNKTF